MAKEDLLHVDGHVFDPDDLTYAERREIKRVARLEIWDEDVDGEFQNLNEDDLMPAFILVFMRRSDKSYTLDQAAEHTPAEVFPEVPPTEPPAKQTAKRNGASRSSSAASTRKAASASTGPQS